jgi:hypothetical protein
MNNKLLAVLTGLVALAAMHTANETFQTSSVILYVLYLIPSMCFVCMLDGVIQYHSNVKIKNDQEGARYVSFVVCTSLIIGGAHLLNMMFYALLYGVGRG